MIKLTGCTNDLIDDITEQIGSLSILECELDAKLSDEAGEERFNIYIDDRRCAVIYNNNDLVLVRFDIDGIGRSEHIESFRFHEVIIS